MISLNNKAAVCKVNLLLRNSRPFTCRYHHMHMACLDQLINCLVDQAAVAPLNGHVHDRRLDVVLGYPLQPLCTGKQKQRSRL